jgi:hypothetical protein
MDKKDKKDQKEGQPCSKEKREERKWIDIAEKIACPEDVSKKDRSFMEGLLVEVARVSQKNFK